ncbi:MAG: tyrosine-type recombinase/integrase, partial [Nitrososphaera sp.]
MSVYKRKDSPHWWIRYTSPGGTVVRVSAQTADRKAASQLEAKMRVEDWNHQKLGKCPRVYWPVAVERFLEEKQAGRGRPWVDALYKLRNLHPHLGALRLDEIDADCLARFVVIRRSHGVSNATINRELEVVRAILKQAHVWGILQSVPAVHKLSEPKRRVRFLTRAEADRLLSELSGELRAMVLFSLATGLREHNVTHLEWSQVDLERRIAWIHADQFKTRKALAVPLNADAAAVLRGQVGRDEVRVFTLNNGNTRSWQQALVRAGIVDFRWHDLR